MPVYKVQAPNGKIYDVEGPENADENMLFGVVQQQLDEEDQRRKMRQYGPGYLETFGRSVARGAGELLSTATDIVPAAVGSMFGFEDYARKNLKEAEEKRAAREAKYPTLFRSYKEIEGIGDFAKYATETVGEQLANIATSLVPGVGVGSFVGRTAATGVAKGLAAQAAERGLAGEAAEQFIAAGLKTAAPQLAQSTLRGQAAGAYLGSYALNAPEVFQNIYEETGELAPGAAALFGSVSAALDAILPAQLARQITGPTKAAIVGKVLEKSGMEKGLARSLTAGILKGVAVEGLTEGAQEAISISAEKFVGGNPQVFGSKEWDRIMESAVKGAVAGGAFGGVGGGVKGLRERAEIKRQEAEEARVRGEEERAQQLEAEAARIEQEAEAASAQIEALQRPTTEAEQEAYGVEAQAGPFSPVAQYGPITPKEYKAQEAQFNKDRKELTKLLEELAPEKLNLVGLAERPPAIEQTTQEAQTALDKLQKRGMRAGELNLEEMRRVGWNEEWNTLVPNIAELAQPEFRKALTSDVTIPVETRQGIIEAAKQLTLPDGAPIIPKTARYSYPDAGSTKIDDLRKISKDVFGVGASAKFLREPPGAVVGEGGIAGLDFANPEHAPQLRAVLTREAEKTTVEGAATKLERLLNKFLPEGAPSVTGIDTETGREGAGVSGKRGRRAAPASVESTERGGVDALTGDAGQPVVGETPQPGALASETVQIPIGRGKATVETQRYWYHDPRKRGLTREGGIAAYNLPPKEKELAAMFRGASPEDKFVYLSPTPLSENSVVVDISSFPERVRQTGQAEGYAIVRGDIPASAIKPTAKERAAEAEFLGEEQVPIEERGAVIRRKKLTPEETKALEEEGVAAAKEEAPAVEPLSKKEIAKAVDAFFGSHYLDREKKLFLPKYEGPAFDATQRRLAETGDINGLIRNLLDSNKDPAIKQVLRRVRSLNLKTKVVIGDPVGEFALPALREPFVESKYRPSVVEWAKRNFGNREYYGTPVWQNFVAWFGDSKVVNEKGEPLVMYHGTARGDIRAFKTKQANAIFVTPNPQFADTFSQFSEYYMDTHWEEFISEEQNRQAYEDARNEIKSYWQEILNTAGDTRSIKIDTGFNEISGGNKNAIRNRALYNLFDFIGDDEVIRTILGGRNLTPNAIQNTPQNKKEALNQAVLRAINKLGLGDIEDLFPSRVEEARRVYFPSQRNIMPLFVRAKNPFNYEKGEHVSDLYNLIHKFLKNPESLPGDKEEARAVYSSKLARENLETNLKIWQPGEFRKLLGEGNWQLLENDIVQYLIRKVMGFDGFYMQERVRGVPFPVKNLAVYNQNQVKSVTNRGRFSERPPLLGLPKAGAYDPTTDTIYLDPELGMNAHTFIHEVMHAAISNVLRNRSHPLTKEFESFFVSIKDRLGDAYGGTDLQEFAAELTSNPSFQALLKSIKTPRSENLFQFILRKIAEFFGFAKDTTAFTQGLKFINAAIDVTEGMEAVPGEKMFLGMGDFSPIGMAGKAMPALVGRTVENARNTLSNLGGGSLLEEALGALRLDNLRQIYKQLPSIDTLQNALERRMGKEEADIKKVNDKYMRFVVIQQKHPEQMRLMDDLSIRASQAEVDITKPFQGKATDVKQEQDHKRLRNEYLKINPEVREVYESIRKDYDDAFKRYRKIIEDAAEGQPGLAAQLREEFETKHPLTGYVPFLRRGDYWLEFTSPETDAPVVMAFESIRERDLFVAQNLRGIPNRKFQRFEDIQYNADSVPPTHFISKVITGLRQKRASQEQINSVYQAYLAAFPAESMAKQFMKRRGIEGMDKDLIRGYGDLMVKWTRKLINSEYTPQIDRALLQLAQEAGDQPPDVAAAARSILRQKAFFHNPSYGKWVSAGTALSYYEFMAGNISSGIINLTSLPLMVFPMLTAKFNPISASGAILSAMKESLPGNNWQNEPKYKKLYDTLMDHGQLEHTMAREVLEGRRQKTGEYTGKMAKFTELVSLPFSVSEKWNRATTAIAAFNLATGSGMSEQKAIEYALETVRTAHTSGMAATSARWLQTPFGRLFGTFKSIIWQQAYVIARAFHQAAKGADSETRKAARHQLLAMYGMATVFVGAKGMPFYGAMSVLAEMLNTMFGDDDEPFDFDEFMRDLLPMFLYKGLVNYALNIEIANRAGLATDIIFRDDPYGVAKHGYVRSALMQAFGPLGSIAGNAERSITLFKDGEYARSFEASLPSALRNVLKSVRYMNEGATTLDGEPIMEDISAYNNLMQVIGFAPADLSNRYEMLQAAKGFEREILERRQKALRMIDMALTAGDMDAFQEAMDRVAKFNEANPDYAITANSIQRSQRARKAAEKDSVYGTRFNKNLLPRIRTEFFEDEE